MAKLDDLKQEATDLGIEFKSKATIAELEQLIADKKAENEKDNLSNGVDNEANQTGTITDTDTTGTSEATALAEAEARLNALKELAKELEIEFDDTIEVSDLEALIQTVLDKAKADQEAREAEEAKAKALAEQEAKEQEPELNKDGFVAGAHLTPKQVAEYLNKQRARK